MLTAQAFTTPKLLKTDSTKSTWRKLKVIKRHSVNKIPYPHYASVAKILLVFKKFSASPTTTSSLQTGRTIPLLFKKNLSSFFFLQLFYPTLSIHFFR